MKKDILKGKKGKWTELPAGGIVDELGASRNFKTGDWRSGKKPKWISKKCIQCLFCWVNCPDKAIPAKKGERTETNLDYCKGCGICAKVCPTKAIEMIKEEK
jgi:pyruvate ferredoxin oxidoreductase delta subunit